MSPVPYGVSVNVWVHDQVNRVERILASLDGVEMRIEQVERLERALTRSHQQNLNRLILWRHGDEARDEEGNGGT